MPIRRYTGNRVTPRLILHRFYTFVICRLKTIFSFFSVSLPFFFLFSFFFGASVRSGHSERDQNCLARKGDYQKRDLCWKYVPIFSCWGDICTKLCRKKLKWFAKERRERLARAANYTISQFSKRRASLLCFLGIGQSSARARPELGQNL